MVSLRNATTSQGGFNRSAERCCAVLWTWGMSGQRGQGAGRCRSGASRPVSISPSFGNNNLNSREGESVICRMENAMLGGYLGMRERQRWRRMKERERGWSEGSERRLSFLLAGNFPAVIREKEGRWLRACGWSMGHWRKAVQQSVRGPLQLGFVITLLACKTFLWDVAALSQPPLIFKITVYFLPAEVPLRHEMKLLPSPFCFGGTEFSGLAVLVALVRLHCCTVQWLVQLIKPGVWIVLEICISDFCRWIVTPKVRS